MEGEISRQARDPVRAVAFGSAAQADRRVAGLAAAARMIHALAEEGASETWLVIGDGAPLSARTQSDIDRLRGAMSVRLVEPDALPPELVPSPAPVFDSMEILRATVKPTDGLVSRHLNRPISQRISWVLLAFPGVRPIHATIASALLAVILFYGMLAGGKFGLILGALLFHAASVIDGVDGEIARATFRATDFGKTLDSAVDMATNLAFLLALTLHLGRHGGHAILWAGFWAVGAVVTGAVLIGLRTRAGGAPLSFDLLKRRGPVRNPIDLIFWVMQTLSGRDCFAFLFMILIIAGLAREALFVFSGLAVIWFIYVLVSLLPRQNADARNAA